MKILLLSFYYHPDLSAGSFRARALVEALQEADPHLEIDVITTLPNRYQSFSADAPRDETQSNTTIHRIALPRHKSGMLDQSASFLSFARGVHRRIRRKEFDLVFATSSRLMTAVLGARVATNKRTKLYLDIRDIFTDNVKYLFRQPVAFAMHHTFSFLERYAISRADKVNLVSGGFVEYFRSRYPLQQFSCFTNGIDEEFVTAFQGGLAGVAREPTRALRVLYAGNIGEGQGLHLIVPALAQKLGSEVFFEVIGDGGRRARLQNAIEESGVSNVHITAPLTRPDLIKAYKQADILFLHLNDFPAFEKVLPSKLFEYSASRKPIWAGVSGFSSEFIRSEIPNAAVFPPCHAEEAIQKLKSLKIQETDRSEFIHKYSRSTVTRRLAEDILSTKGNRR